MAKKRKPAPQPEPSLEEEEEEEEEEENSTDEDDDEVEEEEEEEDLSSKESIRNLLVPFGKDQLIDLLKDAVLRNPSLASRLYPSSAAPAAPAATAANSAADAGDRKIFVHGLSLDATAENLSDAFSPFGEIEDCRVVADRTTGRCKGYGFVLFRASDAARKALKVPQKKIGQRITSCQMASTGPPTPPPPPTARKIFVSRIGDHVSPDQLFEFFARFGEIEEGPLGIDPFTGRLRGFAIFVYRTVEGCRKALEEPFKFFQGCELRCQGENSGMQQNQGLGMVNSMEIMEPLLRLPPRINSVGLGFGGGGSGINSFSPSANARYGPPEVTSVSPTSFVGQNQGFGMFNSMDPIGKLPPSFNRGGVAPYSAGLGFSEGGPGINSPGINSFSTSAIAKYGSPEALSGLERYSSGFEETPMRYRPDVGYYGDSVHRPYFGH